MHTMESARIGKQLSGTFATQEKVFYLVNHIICMFSFDLARINIFFVTPCRDFAWNDAYVAYVLTLLTMRFRYLKPVRNQKENVYLQSTKY